MRPFMIHLVNFHERSLKLSGEAKKALEKIKMKMIEIISRGGARKNSQTGKKVTEFSNYSYRNVVIFFELWSWEDCINWISCSPKAIFNILNSAIKWSAFVDAEISNSFLTENDVAHINSLSQPGAEFAILLDKTLENCIDRAIIYTQQSLGTRNNQWTEPATFDYMHGRTMCSKKSCKI